MRPLTRVFCVDDDREITTLLRYQLEKLGYEQCGVADNAPDAIAGILESRPDIVLIDIELYGKYEGTDIGNFLALETDIPFVYVSGHDSLEVLENARAILQHGFLKKPFDCHKLKAALNMAQNTAAV